MRKNRNEIVDDDRRFSEKGAKRFNKEKTASHRHEQKHLLRQLTHLDGVLLDDFMDEHEDDLK